MSARNDGMLAAGWYRLKLPDCIVAIGLYAPYGEVLLPSASEVYVPISDVQRLFDVYHILRHAPETWYQLHSFYEYELPLDVWSIEIAVDHGELHPLKIFYRYPDSNSIRGELLPYDGNDHDKNNPQLWGAMREFLVSEQERIARGRSYLTISIWVGVCNGFGWGSLSMPEIQTPWKTPLNQAIPFMVEPTHALISIICSQIPTLNGVVTKHHLFSRPFEINLISTIRSLCHVLSTDQEARYQFFGMDQIIRYIESVHIVDRDAVGRIQTFKFMRLEVDGVPNYRIFYPLWQYSRLYDDNERQKRGITPIRVMGYMNHPPAV